MAHGVVERSYLAKFVVGHGSDIEVYVFSRSVLMESRTNVTRRLALGRQAWSELVHAWESISTAVKAFLLLPVT